MRKINPTLQSQGFETFNDLLSKSIPKPSNVISVGPENSDYTSPLDAANAAQSGDLILVFPGTYDVGNNSIVLKDGVNWQFMPGVTISSDSTDGTFKDNGVTVDVKFDGKPIILNTNGFYKIITKVSSSNIDYVIRLKILPVFAPGVADVATFGNPYFTVSPNYDGVNKEFEFIFSSQVPAYHIFPSSFIVIDNVTWKTVRGHNSNTKMYFTIHDISTNNKSDIEDVVDYFPVEIVFSFKSQTWGA